jgi:protein-tyrosine phosphatase
MAAVQWRMVRICFVCLGNICRSPTAEGVMQHIIEREGLADVIELDSAGTAAYHAGERADSRSRATAKRRGIELRSIARKVATDDFRTFDFLLAMDSDNLESLQAMAPTDAAHKLALFRSYDPESDEGAEVPDPYYGGERGFEEVFDICEAAALGLLAHLRREGLV